MFIRKFLKLCVPKPMRRDGNMEFMRMVGDNISDQPHPPEHWKDINTRVELINELDKFLGEEFFSKLPNNSASNATTFQIMDIVNKIDDKFNDDPGLLLRMWAGAISTAKIISLQMRLGNFYGDLYPVTRRNFFQNIQATSNYDLIYRAGVEVAPALKTLRKEEWSLQGIPPHSFIWGEDARSINFQEAETK